MEVGKLVRKLADKENNGYVDLNQILYLNIQGLLGHKDELELIIKKKRPTIVCLSETHITTDIGEHELYIRGYKLQQATSESRHTGGVAIYIREDIKYCKTLDKVLLKNFWATGINIVTKKEKIVLVVLYHSPNASHKEFLGKFEEIMVELELENAKVLVVGDFNIDMATVTSYSKKLQDIVNTMGYEQVVKHPTRVYNNSKTIIDLVITNDEEISVHTIEDVITDHETLLINKNLKMHESKKIRGVKYVSKRRKLTSDDFSKIMDIVEEDKWEVGEDVNTRANRWVGNMKGAINKVNPVREIKWKNIAIANPWFDTSLRLKQKQRNISYKLAKTTMSDDDWRLYSLNRNEYTKSLRGTKAVYYSQKIDECEHDSKKLWKVINNIMGKGKVQNSVKSISLNGIEIEREECANELNNYFLSSVEEIVDNIEEPTMRDSSIPTLVSEQETDGFSEFKNISLAELKDIICKLPNKNGMEGISTEVLKNTFGAYGQELLEVINMSLTQGIFPENWKISTVIPVPKVKNTCKGEEHRPINMLPIYEKVLEKVVHKQLMEYCEQRELISSNQSGFRKNHSCETALQKTLLEWKEDMDVGKITVAIFLDFKRAFETIDKDILLSKLRCKYKMSGSVYKWFKSYLLDRSQETKYDGELSSKQKCRYGVPQGSVLGPLLFIMYINDINECVTRVLLNLFADDTLVYLSGYDIKILCEILNEELKIILDWLRRNKLKLNEVKTKCMLITSSGVIEKKINERKDWAIVMNDGILSFVDEFKYLGVILDKHLKFTSNIEYVSKQISGKTNMLFRLRRFVPAKTLIVIYNALIKPHLNYCGTLLWGVDKMSMSKLQKLQNRAMRAILKGNMYSKIQDMLDTLNWLSIEQMVSLNTLTFIHKIVRGELPGYLQKHISFGTEVHKYNTRRAHNVYVESRNKSMSQRSILYSGMRLYNKIDERIKLMHGSSFRQECVNFVRNNIVLQR